MCLGLGPFPYPCDCLWPGSREPLGVRWEALGVWGWRVESRWPTGFLPRGMFPWAPASPRPSHELKEQGGQPGKASPAAPLLPVCSC